jgi:uncharacterized protein (TIGR02996 family)
MSDREALLAAITANPEEETSRLVYADWLEENDEAERAEFIRLQCRLASMPYSAERRKFETRAAELRTKLFGHLKELPFEITYGWGFVDTVTSGVLDFLDHAAALTPDVAPAFHLILRDSDADERDRALWESDYEAYAEAVGEAAQQRELRRCVVLELPCLGMAPASYLLESPHLTNVRWLGFPHSEAGPVLHAIASPAFKNLRWLNLSSSNSAEGPTQLHHFTDSPHLANLEYLDFSANRVADDDLQSLGESCKLDKLRTLDLADNQFGTFQVSWTLFWRDTEALPALRELDLSRSFSDLEDLTEHAEPDVVADRTRPRLISRLEKLALRECKISDAGAKVLAEFPHELRLTHLDLQGNPIGPAGKRALRKRFGEGVCHFGTRKK